VRQRSEHSYVYIILLTCKEAKEDIVAGLESGADDYLTTPFDPEELKARLLTGLRILDLEDKLVEAREEMRFLATHDTLTHLWNRGVILDLLGRGLARCHRQRENVGLVLADLDHFKEINDTYGHLVGDEVLRETARRLLASVRSYDYVGRYGGEEFLIVLSNCDQRFAMPRADQIRRAISGKPVHTAAGPVQLAMSLGLLLSEEWKALSVEAILGEVDSALYAARAAGRNRVELAVPCVERAFPS